MGRLTDKGLRAVTEYCMNLEHLALSLLSEITGVTLIPLFKDSARALKLKTLNLSCRRVKICKATYGKLKTFWTPEIITTITVKILKIWTPEDCGNHPKIPNVALL